MNDAVWLKLAKRANELLATRDVDGIVITHGTDTMEETAFFLNLTVKSDKPVVLVGLDAARRPPSAPTVPATCYEAVAVAASPGARGRGVLVVLNDEIHAARNVTKTDTTSVETFKSLNRGPQGLVHTAQIAWFEPTDRKHTTRSEFAGKLPAELPRVDIIYAHANMSPSLIDAAVKGGAKGLVVAGVGDGNMTKPAIDALARAAKAGVVVVRSTRLAGGLVLRNNEVNDDQMGFVASGRVHRAQVARAAAAGADQDARPEADPAHVRRVLSCVHESARSSAGDRRVRAVDPRSRGRRRPPSPTSKPWVRVRTQAPCAACSRRWCRPVKQAPRRSSSRIEGRTFASSSARR